MEVGHNIQEKVKNAQTAIFGDGELKQGVVADARDSVVASAMDLNDWIMGHPRVVNWRMKQERKDGNYRFRRSFGMFLPALQDALGEEKIKEIAAQNKPNFLEVGIISQTTAEDLARFKEQVNPRATVSVVDIDVKKLSLFKIGKNGLNLIGSNALSLPFLDHSLDIVMAQGLLTDLLAAEPADKVTVISEMSRCLKIGSSLVMIEGAEQLEIKDEVKERLGKQFEVIINYQPKKISDPRRIRYWKFGDKNHQIPTEIDFEQAVLVVKKLP